MRKMLIVAEEEETRKKSLQSEIDSAKCKLHDVMEFNAEAERKLFDIW